MLAGDAWDEQKLIFTTGRGTRDAPGEKPDVIAILLTISFQLGKGEIIWVEGHQTKVSVRAREHPRSSFLRSFFVVLRNGGYSDPVNVYQVLPRKRAAAQCKSHDGIGSVPRGKLDHVQVCRVAVQPAELSDHKSANAVEAHGSGHRGVEIFEKRIPGVPADAYRMT
jgi:hypothetical protein